MQIEERLDREQFHPSEAGLIVNVQNFSIMSIVCWGEAAVQHLPAERRLCAISGPKSKPRNGRSEPDSCS